MSKEFELSDDESKSFSDAMKYVKKWCSENQWAVGVGEMAVGAGLVAWGVHNGVIEMGSQLVATELGGSGVESAVNTESIAGATGGAGAGAVAGYILGSIGVAGMGGAIGIPAALVIGGAAAVFALAGYAAGDVAHNATADVTTHAVDVNSLVVNGSLLLVGVALIVDGARRCINDAKYLSALSEFKDKVIKLNPLKVKTVAKSMKGLQGIIDELRKLPEDTIDASASAGSAALGAGIGAAAGSTVATGSVTIIGSQALGGMAVSLGLVSAPLWPVIVGVAGGAGLGYAAYKAIKYWGSKPELEDI